MNFIILIIDALSIFIGYLLGSITPGVLFAKLKGKGIKNEGFGNIRTMNINRILGLKFAIPTAIYDTAKGTIAMYVALLIGGNFLTIQLAGFSSIIGHILPFYLKFKGGHRIATSMGIILFYLLQYILVDWEIIYFLIFIMIIAIIFGYISKSGGIIRLMTLPLIGYHIFVTYPNNNYKFFLFIVIGFITNMGLFNLIKNKELIIEDEGFRSHWWRVVSRPFAMLFAVFYIIFSKVIALGIISIVGVLLILLDIIRFVKKNANDVLTVKIKSFLKDKEKNKFSSMTFFLLGAFISILLMEKNVAIISLTFLTFGDIFSKIFGLAFGKKEILSGKTMKGTLAFGGSMLTFGYILYTLLTVPLYVLITDIIIAPIAELITGEMNDNLTVPLITGTAMMSILFFF
jgi:glycerol-3-phosphate acyltransferase PlsY